MPVNDILCKKCGEVEVQHRVNQIVVVEGYSCVPCPNCGDLGEIQMQMTMKNNDWFRPHFNRDISLKGEYVSSKKQLKELCLKNGCINHALGDVRNITEI